MGTRDPMGLTRSRGAGTASAWRAAGVCLGSLHAVVLANGAARWRTRWLRASGPCINAVRRCFGALPGLPCHTGGLCGKGARLERLRHMRPGAHCKSLRGPTHPGSSVRPAAPSASPPLAHPARPPPQHAVRRQQPARRRLFTLPTVAFDPSFFRTTAAISKGVLPGLVIVQICTRAQASSLALVRLHLGGIWKWKTGLVTS